MSDSLDGWFVREILVHEAALLRYLARMWHNSDDLADLRQEIYVRVYESASNCIPIHAKSFLFTTARNLMADLARRARIVSIDLMADLDPLNVLIDELTPERRTGATEELCHLSTAFARLTPRCREVIWMRKVEGLCQKEVAIRLGISEGTVEKHITKGMRDLADALFSINRRAPLTFVTENSQLFNVAKNKKRAD